MNMPSEIAARSGSSLEAEGGEEDEAERDEGLAHLDGDTAISKRSFDAALRAAGSLCQAVDMVMAGEVRNAFCAVRPPGHHAGPVGLVNGEAGGPDSHGFCLLNNISIGAAYAMNVHRETVKKDPVSGGHVGQEGAGRDSGDDTKNAMMEQERAVIVDGQPAQDEEDDEDDDSSFRNDSNSSDSDEDDTSHAAQSYYLSGESKFDRMKRVYGDWKADPLLGRAMPPLILDVG
ncbi:hdaD, partial [Symbiodinium microadriaticum]